MLVTRKVNFAHTAVELMLDVDSVTIEKPQKSSGCMIRMNLPPITTRTRVSSTMLGTGSHHALLVGQSCQTPPESSRRQVLA